MTDFKLPLYSNTINIPLFHLLYIFLRSMELFGVSYKILMILVSYNKIIFLDFLKFYLALSINHRTGQVDRFQANKSHILVSIAQKNGHYVAQFWLEEELLRVRIETDKGRLIQKFSD